MFFSFSIIRQYTEGITFNMAKYKSQYIYQLSISGAEVKLNVRMPVKQLWNMGNIVNEFRRPDDQGKAQ